MMPRQGSLFASAILGGPWTATGSNQATRWSQTYERVVDVSFNQGLGDT